MSKYIYLAFIVLFVLSSGVEAQTTATSAGTITVVHEDGKCPTAYTISEDGTACLKDTGKARGQVQFVPIIPDENGICPGFYIANQNGNKCVKQTVYITTESGDRVLIKTADGSDQKTLSSGKAVATTTENIEVRENKVFLNRKEIKIMPDTASERAIEKLGDLGFSIELKDVGTSDTEKAKYVVRGEREVRVLGIIRAKMRVYADIDAEKGEVTNIVYPWWKVLAR